MDRGGGGSSRLSERKAHLICDVKNDDECLEQHPSVLTKRRKKKKKMYREESNNTLVWCTIINVCVWWREKEKGDTTTG